MLRQMLEFLLSILLLSVLLLTVASQVAYDGFIFILCDFVPLAIRFIGARRVNVESNVQPRYLVVVPT